MKIEYNRQISQIELPPGTTAMVSLVAVKIEDVNGYAQELIGILSDTSWINALNAIGKISFEKTALRTIEKLVNDFKTINNAITSSFGEYVVSISAGQSMGLLFNHIVFPISELWKEKLTNNHGFDFHTESPRSLISFGEAKYSKNSNPYTDAASQIINFIEMGKDGGDAALIAHFASKKSIENLLQSSRGFTIAFSLNSENIETILMNALGSDLIVNLCKMCDELQIVGVLS